MSDFLPGIGLFGYGSERRQLIDPEHAERFKREGGVVLVPPIKAIRVVMGDGDIFKVKHEVDVPIGGRIIKPDGSGCYDPHFIRCRDTRQIINDIHARLGLERH